MHLQDAIRCWLTKNAPGFYRFSITTHGEYLGVHIGPGAGPVQWSKVCKKVCGYNSRCVSVFSYLAQILHPPTWVLADEKRMLAS
eukprot:5659961-Karenia_brevis.AAC.1